MDHEALLFGGATRPGRRTGEARRGHLDLIGAGSRGVDEGLDMNVHAFWLSPTSLQLAPKGASEFGRAVRGKVAASPGEGIGEIGDPDCFISLTHVIRSLPELGMVS